MYTTLSGQIAVAKQIDMIANNIANMNTSGFKAERPIFEKVLNDQNTLLTSSLRKDVSSPNPWASEEFAVMKGSYTNLEQGPSENTGNPLDVSIQGKGFFVVQTAAGERYTRAGSFKLDSSGKLVTQGGSPVMGQGGEITVGQGTASVSDDGTITVDGKAAGKLRIVDIDPAQIQRESEQLFSSKTGATDLEKATVAGGSLETSNVNAVRELADMIMASRLFEGLKNVEAQVSSMDQARNDRLGTTTG